MSCAAALSLLGGTPWLEGRINATSTHGFVTQQMSATFMRPDIAILDLAINISAFTRAARRRCLSHPMSNIARVSIVPVLFFKLCSG